MRHIMRAEIPSSPFHSRKKVGWKRSRERNAQTAPSSLGFPPPSFFLGAWPALGHGYLAALSRQLIN